MKHTQKRNGLPFIVTKGIDYSPINDQIKSVRLCEQSKDIPFYAAIIDAKKEQVNEFYNQVQFEINRTSKQEVLLMTGDQNAKVVNIKEEDIFGLYGLGN